MAERIYTEEEVQDLTDRVFLLKEKLESGKMHFAAHLVDDFRSSFEAIRLRPDGKVDPRTVDGRIRASTLALMAMKQREDMKKSASLQDLQEKYFEFLFEQFGWLYDQMVQNKAPPYAIASHFSEKADLVDNLFSVIPDFEKAVKDFWEVAGEISEYHLQDGHQLKAVYCQRKLAEGVVADPAAALKRLHKGLQGKDWCSAQQNVWIVRRVAILLSWPIAEPLSLDTAPSRSGS